MLKVIADKWNRIRKSPLFYLIGLLFGLTWFYYHIISTSHKPLPVSPYKENGDVKPGWGSWA